MTQVVIARWIISLIGVLALAGLVWLFGPLLPVLEEATPRLAVVGLMVVLWACANLLIDLQRSGREKALSTGVTGGASADEAAALEGGLAKALALLKRKQKGRVALYEQPWYVIIGPPGAGKTTALLNAGLNFPLSAEMGKGAVAGVGGTRLCDWWFTDEAVLIDTAGRYTTQDSDAEVDRAGWEAFLDLLRRTRPRQPLNGVIVAIALSDIAANAAAETTRHAAAISRRLRELEQRLGVRLPVYALFTKADLIVGFSEFFSDMTTDSRRQVWGFTFPHDKTTDTRPKDQAALAAPFLQLAERLNEKLIPRLATEPSAERRSLIAGFPIQVASLAQPLARFLDEAFGAAPVPLLRGAYFASGTQEGTPIDRLTGVLSRSFGLDQRRAANLRPEQGRSYFLGHLLTRVVFGEALLTSDNPGGRRRLSLLRLGIIGVAVTAVAGAGLVLWRVHAGEMAAIEAATTALAAYEQTAQSLPLDPVADDDLRRLAPLLDQARALPHSTEPDGTGLGLSQTGKLAQASRTVYRHALERALLPRLIWRVEAQMRANLTRLDFLYEATRIDLMLGGLGPLDAASVRDWTAQDWLAAYPGPGNADLRKSLATHLDALLAEALPAVPLDGALIVQARARFSKVALAQRVYGRIAASPAAQKLPPWTPAEALGPAGARLFVRSSGRRLTEGVPGLFTHDGYTKVLLPQIAPAAETLASESWVLGEKTGYEATAPQLRALQEAVVALYGAEDSDIWDRLLADLEIAPLRSLTQAAQDLFILSSPQSPVRRLMASVISEISLSAPDAPVLTAVETHFQALRGLVGDGSAKPLDPVLQSLYELQQQLAKLAAAPIGSVPQVSAGLDPAVSLRAQAARLPQPLSRWMTAMATAGTALRSGNARQQISSVWNAAGGPGAACAQAVKGRYPFERAATTDVTLAEFGRLLAPGGVIDGFFNTQLAPYADTTGKVWRPKSPDGTTPPVSAEDLAQFQRAATLRDLFFPGGATSPTLRFELVPITVEPTTTTATLDLEGTEIRLVRGPLQSTPIVWPGRNQMQNVHLLFNPPIPGAAASELADTGPWALFRMMARARQQPAAAGDSATLVFQLADRRATYEARFAPGANPFAPGLADAFRCPVMP